MGRKILYAALAVLAVVGAGIATLALSFERLVRAAVEDRGPAVTGGTVTLGRLDVSALGGEVRIADLVIGNPPGFKTDSALRLAEVRLKVRFGSLLSERIALTEIAVTGPRITYELGPGGSNLAVLQRNIAQFTAAAKSATPAGGDPQPVAKPVAGGRTPAHTSRAGSAGGRTVTIDVLTVRDAEVRLAADLLPGRGAALPLPNLTLRDLGGASAAEVFGLVMAELNASAAKAVAGLGIDRIREGIVKDAGGVTGRAREKSEEAVKDAERTIKKLLGR